MGELHLTCSGRTCAVAVSDGGGPRCRRDSQRRHAAPVTSTRGIWRRRITWLSGGSALLSVALNEFVLASVVTADGALSASSVFVIRITQLALLSVATVLMAFRSPMAGIIDRLRVKWSAARAESASVLAVSIAVPWALLFLVSDGERRYWWIWPLQVTVLAAAVTYVPTRLGVTRWVVRLASIGLMIVVMANTVLLSRLNDWLQHGWSGRDAVEVEATDRLAERIKGSGSNRAFIGYENRNLAVHGSLEHRRPSLQGRRRFRPAPAFASWHREPQRVRRRHVER